MIDYGFSTKDVELEEIGLPVGEYTVKAIKEEVITTKSGGKSLRLDLEVIDTDAKGRKGSTFFNIFSDNEQARKIAQSDIKKLAVATGRDIDSSNPIAGRFFKVIVTQDKKNPQYTRVVKYLEAENQSAGF